MHKQIKKYRINSIIESIIFANPSNYLKFIERNSFARKFLEKRKGQTLAEKLYFYKGIKDIKKKHRNQILKLLDDSKSQFRQDLWVLSQTDFKTNGFFVEIGTGGSEYNFSNTDILEKNFSWNGILVEPNPSYYELLRENRTCFIEKQPIYSTTNQSIDFSIQYYGGLSGIRDHVLKDRLNTEIKSMSLKSLSLYDLILKYNAPSMIDYLSIDTEGSEYEILKNMDFDKYKFRAITVEHHKRDYREKIYNLLETKGYRRIMHEWSDIEDWYVYE